MLEGAEALCQRPLPEEMALVYLDGFFLKVLREGLGVEREAVYVALGVSPCGARRVLGF
ncbi:Transposase, Mutator family [Calidithermus roseus]|uniref:Transposase, Mutator family n=1 Tax=Calidithermus roseus TaxID=1644118 RepID=A0A399EST5_9DEIN|nr:Transposase, Mutator family [Calidithermus roseus]